MMETNNFEVGLLDRWRVAYHKDKVRLLQVGIAEMERGDVRHYCEGSDGRLNVDTTARMIEVHKASMKVHVQAMCLLSRPVAPAPLTPDDAQAVH